MYKNKKEHLSYGAVSLSTVSGKFDNLFGSSIETHSVIKLKINHASEVDYYGTTKHVKEDRIIEIYLSPNQFSELITTMNVGEGVPCTINWTQGDGLISRPENTNRRKVSEKFMKEIVSELVSKIEDIQDFANEISKKNSVSKKDKEKLKFDLGILRNHMESNIPFVEQTFKEVLDKSVVEAKADIDSFVTHTITKFGLEHIDAKRKLLVDGNE